MDPEDMRLNHYYSKSIADWNVRVVKVRDLVLRNVFIITYLYSNMGFCVRFFFIIVVVV